MLSWRRDFGSYIIKFILFLQCSVTLSPQCDCKSVSHQLPKEKALFYKAAIITTIKITKTRQNTNVQEYVGLPEVTNFDPKQSLVKRSQFASLLFEHSYLEAQNNHILCIITTILILPRKQVQITYTLS